LLTPEYEGDETTKYACYGMVYLITETCKEFGITRQDVVVNLEAMGYDIREAIRIVDRYETWAQKVKIKETTMSSDNC